MNPPNQTFRASVVLTLAILVLAGIWALPTSHAQGQVQVNAADPSTASQGTINLNVRVTGKGFKNGAKAKWFVTGTADTGGITVNSTTFVTSTELTANITVADTASIANFDIQVTNSDGRGGKGTELFAVTPKGAGLKPSEVSLNVTIEPLAGTCNICPDNAATPIYSSGVDSVNAAFGTHGHLAFFSGNRSVRFLYSTSLGDSLTNKTLPSSEQPTEVRARTFNTTDPYTNLQDMLIGQQQCLGLGWFIGEFTNSVHSVGFHYGRGNLSNTSFVVVTRNDQDTWTMEPGPQSMCSLAFLND
ncbi:MAG TPA: hypothetical protein VF251_09575, partial [Pyrinomonadaceae bacterium]